MLIAKRPSGEPLPSEITPRDAYLKRRALLKTGVAALALATARPSAAASAMTGRPLDASPGPFGTSEKRTPYEVATTYNNFYEFGTDKSDPAEHAHTLITNPWTVRVEGEVEKPTTFGIEELLAAGPLEERVYRLRCVEGWSMVIPWIGYPFRRIAERVRPTSAAAFVEFETLADPGQMPGLRQGVLKWPYKEGLRIDEAMHPLTLLTLGMYGKTLPNQNGAPVRIVVPWKYGFKSAKSIVAIRFVRREPITSWNRVLPNEYGFYSNVNPEVDHPRWSQAKELRLDGAGLLNPKRPTLMFNGYGEQVASLYAGMDLKRKF